MKAQVLDLTPAPASADPRQTELASRVTALTDGDGVHRSPIATLSLVRASAPSAPTPTVYEPCLCIVVQGRKRAALADEVYVYDPLNYLIVSVLMPVVGQIIEATPQRPYLCLRIDIDRQAIAELLLQLGPQTAAGTRDDRGLFVARMDAPLLDAVLRLVRLLDTPDEAVVLAPLALREIHYRVLLGALGPRLRGLVQVDGQARRINLAIEMLKTRYTEPLSIEALAEAAHMSASSLHHRFKAVTARSPLQFQKQLRLHEARRLMLTEGCEAARAGHRVGYESASQFSREYKRLFGAPPSVEIASMRAVIES